jgi:hypothetical protein
MACDIYNNRKAYDELKANSLFSAPAAKEALNHNGN